MADRAQSFVRELPDQRKGQRGQKPIPQVQIATSPRAAYYVRKRKEMRSIVAYPRPQRKRSPVALRPRARGGDAQILIYANHQSFTLAFAGPSPAPHRPLQPSRCTVCFTHRSLPNSPAPPHAHLQPLQFHRPDTPHPTCRSQSRRRQRGSVRWREPRDCASRRAAGGWLFLSLSGW